MFGGGKLSKRIVPLPHNPRDLSSSIASRSSLPRGFPSSSRTAKSNGLFGSISTKRPVGTSSSSTSTVRRASTQTCMPPPGVVFPVVDSYPSKFQYTWEDREIGVLVVELTTLDSNRVTKRVGEDRSEYVAVVSTDPGNPNNSSKRERSELVVVL